LIAGKLKSENKIQSLCFQAFSDFFFVPIAKRSAGKNLEIACGKLTVFE
jgi:hypothetical protein